MNRGDLIFTPAGTWHDHGNDGECAVAYWVDVLNVPLVESLNATQFEFSYSEPNQQSNTGDPIEKTLQTVREPDDHSQRLYGTGGIKPLLSPAGAVRPSTRRCSSIDGRRPAQLSSGYEIIQAARMTGSSLNISIRQLVTS